MTENFNPDVQQAYSDTCAIKSQQLILNDFGIPCTEDDLVRTSIEQGWYDGNGTSMQDVGNLLEYAGIECSRQAGANVFNLVGELSQGHKIIVGVDSDELWNDDTITGKLHNWFKDVFVGDTPDHALIVAGIDTSDPDNVKVLITDPGTGEEMKAYPLDQFMNAWSDAQCYMVSTECAVPQTVPGMENFDIETGHISNVAGMDYTDFQIFNDLSYGIPVWQPSDFGGFCSPMTSFVNGYFDVVNNNVQFADLFGNQDFLFNQYLTPQCIMDNVFPEMSETFAAGVDMIDFTPDNDWLHYVDMNALSGFTNMDYGNFLDQSILNFQAMGDIQSAMYCEQQHMMLDLCDHYGFDFNDSFLSY